MGNHSASRLWKTCIDSVKGKTAQIKSLDVGQARRIVHNRNKCQGYGRRLLHDFDEMPQLLVVVPV